MESDVSVGSVDFSLFCEQIVFCDMELTYWPPGQCLSQAYCVVGVASEIVTELGEAVFLDRKPTLPQRLSEWCSKDIKDRLGFQKGISRGDAMSVCSQRMCRRAPDNV